MDSLIRIGAIPKFVMVGVFSNEELVPDKEFEYRNYEYIMGWVGSLFRKEPSVRPNPI